MDRVVGNPDISVITNSGGATGDTIYWDGTKFARLAIGVASQKLNVIGGIPAWQTLSNSLTKSAEQSSTPVTDNIETGILGDPYYSYFTVPSTYPFIVPSGIEWKNGSAVAGNVVASLWATDANPAVLAAHILLATCEEVAQATINVVQRVSIVSAPAIMANTIVAMRIDSSNNTGKFRFQSGLANRNINKTVAYAASPPNSDNTAWGAATQEPYIKLYYFGFS